MASSKKVVCLLGPGFEESEYQIPVDRLRDAGVHVDVIGPKAGDVLHGDKGRAAVMADLGIDDVRPQDYDLLLIPGGHSPDALRADKRFVDFVKAFEQTHRPIAAVCHGPQLLVAAHLVRGRTLTAWKTIQDDLAQMGANVKDEPVVIDRNWITSRQPGDLVDFSNAALKVLGVTTTRLAA
ncbi:MAG: type 1 glutamine amidotransferase [Candidatus Sericytochromatia bacterium]|nr:type 1 glutamine amidotransferase [Candidatus Sericytochromatia bacterium]